MEIFYSEDITEDIVRLDEEESAHCVRVLRHRKGDDISVIDGRGTLLECRLVDDSPKGAVARIVSRRDGFGAHPYRLTMAVCPTKNIDRFEWFTEKATEIGVDTVVPVIGEHSERKTVKTDRLKRIVLSAAKQSLKGAVPEVAEPASVRKFIESAPDGALKLIAYCFDGGRISVQEALAGAHSTDEIYILIGPEGDFSEGEAQLAISRGWQPVHLGDSRLRTETAALVAATSVYLHFIG